MSVKVDVEAVLSSKGSALCGVKDGAQEGQEQVWQHREDHREALNALKRALEAGGVTRSPVVEQWWDRVQILSTQWIFCSCVNTSCRSLKTENVPNRHFSRLVSRFTCVTNTRHLTRL